MVRFHSIKIAKKILREGGIKTLIETIIRYSVQIFVLPYYILKIKFSPPNSIEKATNFEYRSIAGILKPAQVKSEIIALLKEIKDLNPKNMLEIGTGKGGTLFLFTRVANEKAKIISMDMRGGSFGGGYPFWKIPLFKSFKSKKQKIILIRSNSHEISSRDRIKSILGDKELDFLFIDGDHTYEGVKRDFEIYGPLVRKGGIIALHDVALHKDDCKVYDFWQEIKKNNPGKYTEIIEDKDQGWAGIGIVRNK